MTLGLRARMGVTAAAATATALLAVHFLAEPGLRRRTLEETRTTLFAEARLMARVVEEGLARGAPPSELDPLVDEAAREVRARVTIVAPDGRVVADSSVSGPDLAALENHGGRPEVRQALRADQIRNVTVEQLAAMRPFPRDAVVALPADLAGRLSRVPQLANATRTAAGRYVVVSP